MNRPATPTATPARASIGTISRAPPPTAPRPPGFKPSGRRTPRRRCASRPGWSASATRLVVAEAHAAPASQSPRQAHWHAAARALSMTFFASQGARNWPFLDVHRFADCATARMKSVWRHRKAGAFSISTTLATSATCEVVHVGQDGQPQLAAHFIEDLQARLQPTRALAGARRAVGLWSNEPL